MQPSSVTPPDAGRGRIRTLERGDIPQLVALTQEAFLDSERAGDSMAAYFERIFFHNPWIDPDLPSLVYEDEAGRVGGFVGVVPRRMMFRGERIRVAVTTQLVVAPRYGGQVGRRLLRQVLSGPQELSITDDANDAARRLWESLGGECSPIYGLRWTRPLRPCGYAVRRLARGAFGRGVVLAARPLLAAADAIAVRLPGPTRLAPPPGTLEPLDAPTMVAHLEDVVGGHALRPVYDAGSLEWLFAQLAEKAICGALRQMLVRGPTGQVVGWFVYCLHASGTSEVIQVAARRSAERVVLRFLLWDAWRQGAWALAGRVEPWLVDALGGANWAILRWLHQWTLLHSRRPEILRAIEQGDALLSHLDGEWWLSF